MAQNPVRFPVDSETTFLEDRFIDTSPDIRIEAAYHRIRGISVSKSGDIYLWIGSDFAFIIPHSFFPAMTSAGHSSECSLQRQE